MIINERGTEIQLKFKWIYELNWTELKSSFFYLMNFIFNFIWWMSKGYVGVIILLKEKLHETEVCHDGCAQIYVNEYNTMGNFEWFCLKSLCQAMRKVCRGENRAQSAEHDLTFRWLSISF